MKQTNVNTPDVKERCSSDGCNREVVTECDSCGKSLCAYHTYWYLNVPLCEEHGASLVDQMMED